MIHSDKTFHWIIKVLIVLKRVEDSKKLGKDFKQSYDRINSEQKLPEILADGQKEWNLIQNMNLEHEEKNLAFGQKVINSQNPNSAIFYISGSTSL